MNRWAVALTTLALGALVAGGPRAEAKAPPLPPAHAPTLAGQLSPDTTVKLVLLDRLKSGTCRKGDRVNFQVDEDIVDPAGTILVRKGTAAFGTVVRSRRNGMFGKAGALELAFDYTTAVDGQKVSLRGTQDQRGKNRVGGTVALMLLVSLWFMFQHGGNVTWDPGTALMAWPGQTVTVGAPVAAAPLTGVSGSDAVPASSGK